MITGWLVLVVNAVPVTVVVVMPRIAFVAKCLVAHAACVVRVANVARWSPVTCLALPQLHVQGEVLHACRAFFVGVGGVVELMLVVMLLASVVVVVVVLCCVSDE